MIIRRGTEVFIKKYGDLATGIFFLLLSVFYFSQISTIEIIDSGSIDAAFIPKLVAGAMFILSVFLIITASYKLKQKKEERERKEAGKMAWKSMLMTSALLILYVALFESRGFLVTTTVYLFFQLAILAPERKPKQLVIFAFSSVVASLLLQYVFIHLLFVMLPQGILR